MLIALKLFYFMRVTQINNVKLNNLTINKKDDEDIYYI